MAKYEQFMVVKVGEDQYENIPWGVSGTLAEVKKYAADNDYGDGVVEFVELPFGYEVKKL